MFRVFNMGIGLVLIVSRELVQAIVERASALGEKTFLIGEVTEGPGRVSYV